MSVGGRRPGAGRPRGSKNKRTLEVEEQLAELGCRPIEGMARIGMKAEEEGDLVLAGRMYAELAQYVAPKRRAVDVNGSGTVAMNVYLSALIAPPDEAVCIDVTAVRPALGPGEVIDADGSGGE